MDYALNLVIQDAVSMFQSKWSFVRVNISWHTTVYSDALNKQVSPLCFPRH